MNRLIIVGNGFDKAHGLPTGYDDFIKWYHCDVVKSILTLKGDNVSSYRDKLCEIKTNEVYNHDNDPKDLPVDKYGRFYRNNISLIALIVYYLRLLKPNIKEVKLRHYILKDASEDKMKEEEEKLDLELTEIYKKIDNAFEHITYYFGLRKRRVSQNESEEVFNAIKELDDYVQEGSYIMSYIWRYLTDSKKAINNLKKSNKKNKYFEIIFNPSHLFKKIINGIKSPLWSGIESDYYELLCDSYDENKNKDKDTQHSCYMDLNSQLNYLKEKLIVYLEEVENKKRNLAKISSIENAIRDPIKSEEIYLSGINGEIEPKDTMVLNFNYTHTVKQRYNRGNRFEEIHIHGIIDNHDSIIFGYGDEMDTNFIKLKEHKDKECRSNIKSVLYYLSDNYSKLLSFIESDTFQVLIMGHSCGMFDRTLLNTIFEHKNCVSIKPYYKKEDGTDNFLEMCQNINRNFNDTKLYHRQVVTKPYCSPLIP